jgi:small subunit ribosomal protein S18
MSEEKKETVKKTPAKKEVEVKTETKTVAKKEVAAEPKKAPVKKEVKAETAEVKTEVVTTEGEKKEFKKPAFSAKPFVKGSRPAKRKSCSFCMDKTSKGIDYKESHKLRKFLAENGKIKSRRETGTCAKHQREMTFAIKTARQMALLPFKVD